MSHPPEPPAHSMSTGLAALGIIALAGAWLSREAMVPGMYDTAWIVAIPGFLILAAAVCTVRAASLRTRVVLRDAWTMMGVALALAFVASVAAKLPMRAGFLYVKHPLTRSVEWDLAVGGPIGPYTFAPGPQGDYCGTPGITLFRLEDAGALAAFVHAPQGIDGLCYNEGAAGHLAGDWYWKVED